MGNATCKQCGKPEVLTLVCVDCEDQAAARLEASEAEVKRLKSANDSLLTVNLEAVHERDDANVTLAALRSQLSAMTEAVNDLLPFAESRAEDLSEMHERGLGTRKAWRVVEAARAVLKSPTSSKEWEEKVRAKERERVVRSFTGPDRVAFDAAMRALK